jgi:hypothetical protein
LCADRSVFDFCNLATYNEESIQPLLEHHGLFNATRLKKWIAVVDTGNMTQACGVSSSWVTSTKLKWAIVGLAPEIQSLGSEGFITHRETVTMTHTLNLPYLDRSKQTIYDTRIDTFATYIAGKGAWADLLDLLGESYEAQTPLLASVVSSSLNPLDTAVEDPLSGFRVLSNIFSIASLMCTVYNIRVLRRYYTVQGRLPLNSYCTIGLLLNLTANILRMIKSVDVLGVSTKHCDEHSLELHELVSISFYF